MDWEKIDRQYRSRMLSDKTQPLLIKENAMPIPDKTLQADNKAAYAAFQEAATTYRAAIAVAADSPIPGDTWHNIGRGMELIQRTLDALKKG